MRKRTRIILLLVVPFLVLGLTWAVGIYFPRVGATQEKANEAFFSGNQLFNDYQYRAASEFFLKSLSYNPEFHVARRFLGQALYYSGEIDDAVNEWKIILEQGHYDPPLRHHVQNLTSAAVKTDANLVYNLSIESRPGYRFQFPTYVGALPSHNIFILTLGTLKIGNMLEMDPNGEFVDNRRRISGRLQTPMGAAIGPEEIWISDYGTDTIRRLSAKPQPWYAFFSGLDAVGGTGSGAGKFHGPAGICYSGGFYYVADSGNNRVQKLDGAGKSVLEFGRISPILTLNKPFGLACSKDGRVLVSEPDESRVSVFDEFGNFEKFLGDGFLEKPRHLSMDPSSDFLIISDERAGVFLVNQSTGERQNIRGFEDSAGEFRPFNRPYSAGIDYFGNMFVADYGEHAIFRFVPEHFMHSNLEIWVERIHTASFPKVALWVSVRDQRGKFITDLADDNFRIIENDADVGRINADYLKDFNDQATWVILLSRGRKMKSYSDSMDWVNDFYLSRLREKDKVQVITYGDDYQTGSPWTNSRLRLKQAVKVPDPETGYSESVNGFGAAFYNGISRLLPEKGRRALIWITEGELPKSGSENFSMSRLENYALINHIPVHIVSFQHPDVPDRNETMNKMKQMAERTGGRYFFAYDSGMKDMEKNLRSTPEKRYVLVYESPANKSWKGQYMELKVSARFQNRTGTENSGYFIPVKP